MIILSFLGVLKYPNVTAIDMPWGTFANFSFITCDTELDQEIVIKLYNSSYPAQCSHDNRTVVDAETVSRGYTCTIMDFAGSRDNLTCIEMTIRIWNGNGTVDPFTHIKIVAEIENHPEENTSISSYFDVSLMPEATAPALVNGTQSRPTHAPLTTPTRGNIKWSDNPPLSLSIVVAVLMIAIGFLIAAILFMLTMIKNQKYSALDNTETAGASARIDFAPMYFNRRWPMIN